MGWFSKIFGRKKDEETKIGGMEDYMTLVRVYFQSALAEKIGITDMRMVPDLRTFKSTLHIPTERNKLGVAEKARCKKMMKEIYNTDDGFFSEIDASIKKNCKKITDVQPYLLQFQGFSQDLMMLMGNLMKFKLRMPSMFKKTLYAMTEKTVNDILNKNDWKDDAMRRSVVAIRRAQATLGYSEQWIVEFAHTILMLAKKEPRNKIDDEKK